MKLPASLQGRLLVLVGGAVLALWTMAAALTWVDARHELDELLDSHLAQSAALLLAQQWRAGEHGEDDDHGRRNGIQAPLLHRYAPRTAFQVWHEGRLALKSANAPATPMAAHTQGFATVAIDGGEWRVFATRGAEHDMQVYMGEQTDSRRAILWAVLRSLATPLAVALPLLALAGWWAVRQGLAPLRRLGTLVAARQAQALQPVDMADAPAEMVPLITALNGLFGRIAELLDTERRFTADAAHELRTPIAAVRMQAQVALGATADDERRRALQATLAGCDRATHLVAQLLALSRLESAAAPPDTPVDLAAVARRVVAEQAGAALDKDQDLSLDATTPCPVPGDDALLAMLLRNLVDNAVRYSPRGARLRVQAAVQQGMPTLVVEDSGPGLAEADRARLGERFFRVLGSGESGSGLGWSIVRRIAAALHAQVAVDASPELGGLRVRLSWPG